MAVCPRRRERQGEGIARSDSPPGWLVVASRAEWCTAHRTNLDGTPTTVRLQNLLAAEGDADGDRDVDITDFNVLASHFDPAGVEDPLNGPFWNEGNFDGDGDTDITDFNFLASNFAPSGYSTSAIPEPSTMLLASLALILVGVSFRLSKNG